jgi:hypothetical protein
MFQGYRGIALFAGLMVKAGLASREPKQRQRLFLQATWRLRWQALELTPFIRKRFVARGRWVPAGK